MSSTRKGARAVRPGAALAVLAAAQFAVALSTSIVNVALPAVRDGVGLSDSGMSWVVNSYGLAFGALLLLGGRTADLVGRRRVLLGGLALFAAASVAAGLATGPWALITARTAQGVGAAAVAPAALSWSCGSSRRDPDAPGRSGSGARCPAPAEPPESCSAGCSPRAWAGRGSSTCPDSARPSCSSAPCCWSPPHRPTTALTDGSTSSAPSPSRPDWSRWCTGSRRPDAPAGPTPGCSAPWARRPCCSRCSSWSSGATPLRCCRRACGRRGWSRPPTSS